MFSCKERSHIPRSSASMNRLTFSLTYSTTSDVSPVLAIHFCVFSYVGIDFMRINVEIISAKHLLLYLLYWQSKDTDLFQLVQYNTYSTWLHYGIIFSSEIEYFSNTVFGKQSTSNISHFMEFVLFISIICCIRCNDYITIFVNVQSSAEKKVWTIQPGWWPFDRAYLCRVNSSILFQNAVKTYNEINR